MTGPDDRPATPAVEIAAHRESRWRCGVEHKARARLWPAGSWTAEQLEQLKADPRLTVIEHHPDGTRPVEAVGDLVRQADQLTDLDLAVLMGLIGAMAYDRQITQATMEAARDLLEARAADPDPMNTTASAKDADGGASQEAPAGNPEEADKPPPPRFDFIVEQCQQLDPENPDHKFTADGRPHVSSLETITGLKDISAKERDDAWEAFKARERN